MSIEKYIILFVLYLYTQSLYAQPSVSSFAPISGPIGTTVTITGANFSTTPAANVVYFGATRATVLTATANSIQVNVPAGATYQPITVTTNHLTAYSTLPFTVTFGNSDSINSNSFAPKIDFEAGSPPRDVSIADIDNDGKPDLVVANGDAPSFAVSILRNTSTNGTISFAPKIDFPLGSVAYRVAIGDLDGDGMLDLAVIVNGDTVSVLRNTSTNGTISFESAMNYPVEGFAKGLSIGDLNEDGKPDIAVVDYYGNRVSVLRNTSTNGAISFASKVTYAIDEYPAGISIVDLDGDGKPDIAAANSIPDSVGSVSILRNTSTGGDISFAPKEDYATGSISSGVTISDLDRDGKPDLSVMNSGVYGVPATVSIFRNISTTGTISFDPKIDFRLGFYPWCILSGDLNGDGKTDLATANDISLTVSISQNVSDNNTISFASEIDYETSGNSSYSVAIGDLDGDSKPELVVANSGFGSTISVLRNIIGEALLISLFNFIGKPLKNEIQLQWQTTTEQNSSHFNVEYATNGVIFSTIGTVKAAGNSSSVKSYSFIDTKPKSGVNYYRLKIVDADGKFTYSSIERVQLDNKKTGLTLYPNPTKEYVIVEHPASNNLTHIKVIDMMGRVVKTINVSNGTIHTNMNVESLPPGIYKIVWSNGVSTQNQTMVIE